ncbi:hypothetical protein Hdeb2414_s0005g00166721 [Helianthus debilis subsp. tardiflorus]
MQHEEFITTRNGPVPRKIGCFCCLNSNFDFRLHFFTLLRLEGDLEQLPAKEGARIEE